MSRKPEIILSIIGVITTVVSGIFFSVLVGLFTNDEFIGMLESDPSMDPSLAMTAEETELLSLIGSFGIGFFVILTIITAVLGIVGAVVIKGNRKPKLGGGLLIASAVIGAVASGFGFIIPAVFFLIAGIMCFARKPKAPVNQTYSEDVRPL